MKNRKGFTLIELMIVIAIIGILAAMAVPNFKKARMSARQKACYSNIRVILGAIEMYNMDNSAMISTVNQSLIDGQLVSAGYLKTKISKPETQCSYYSTADITTTGLIACSYHGTIESSADGGVEGEMKF